jgi:hypothetical protein
MCLRGVLKPSQFLEINLKDRSCGLTSPLSLAAGLVIVSAGTFVAGCLIHLGENDTGSVTFGEMC